MIGPRSRAALIAFLLLLLMGPGCAARSSAPTPDRAPAPGSLRAVLEARSGGKPRVSLLVEKSKYRLTVYDHDTAVKSYPIVLGGNPAADKLREGDRCTPEGQFQIQDKYPHPSWRRFLWINYPTPDSWRKHRRAKADGKIPPDAAIGGEIGIHGVPEGQDRLIDQRINWTLGCVSLKNADMEELYEVVEKGAPVTIVP